MNCAAFFGTAFLGTSGVHRGTTRVLPQSPVLCSLRRWAKFTPRGLVHVLTSLCAGEFYAVSNLVRVLGSNSFFVSFMNILRWIAVLSLLAFLIGLILLRYRAIRLLQALRRARMSFYQTSARLLAWSKPTIGNT